MGLRLADEAVCRGGQSWWSITGRVTSSSDQAREAVRSCREQEQGTHSTMPGTVGPALRYPSPCHVAPRRRAAT